MFGRPFRWAAAICSCDRWLGLKGTDAIAVSSTALCSGSRALSCVGGSSGHSWDQMCGELPACDLQQSWSTASLLFLSSTCALGQGDKGQRERCLSAEAVPSEGVRLPLGTCKSSQQLAARGGKPAGPGEANICWLASGPTCTFILSCNKALGPLESPESSSVENISCGVYCYSTPIK